MTIREAKAADIQAVAAIYDAIHTCEEAGLTTIGWVRGVYPTQQTAQAVCGFWETGIRPQPSLSCLPAHS